MQKPNRSLLREILEKMSLPNTNADITRVIELLPNRRDITGVDIAKGFKDNTLDDILLRLKIADGSMVKNAKVLIAKIKSLNL